MKTSEAFHEAISDLAGAVARGDTLGALILNKEAAKDIVVGVANLKMVIADLLQTLSFINQSTSDSETKFRSHIKVGEYRDYLLSPHTALTPQEYVSTHLTDCPTGAHGKGEEMKSLAQMMMIKGYFYSNQLERCMRAAGHYNVSPSIGRDRRAKLMRDAMKRAMGIETMSNLTREQLSAYESRIGYAGLPGL